MFIVGNSNLIPDVLAIYYYIKSMTTITTNQLIKPLADLGIRIKGTTERMRDKLCKKLNEKILFFYTGTLSRFVHNDQQRLKQR